MRTAKYTWISLGIIIGISALAYLPLIHTFGYFNDDWYLMYDVRVHGVQFFHDIFSSDRPGRAYLMIPMYSLFGLNPLPYNIFAYLFRVLGGASFFWILCIVWPDRKNFALTAAILFTIYPGFLSQHNAIDYQSHIWALFFALLSVALTLKFVSAETRRAKIVSAILSVLSGWAYLSQMEYFIGVEAFRLACVAVLVWRTQQGLRFLQKARETVLKWFPFASIPAGFLIWRIFLFETGRKATDIGSQLGQLFASPLTGLWWLTYLVQDVFNVLFAPWALPFSLYVLSMRLQDQLIGFGLAGAAIILFVWGSHWVLEEESETLAGSGAYEMHEQVWVGVVGMIGGLAPVIAANRHIVLPDFSRYTLVASIGGVILLSAFLHQISSRHVKVFVSGILVAISVLTHYGNSVKASVETETVRTFWWQVAWRAPQIQTGTTLSATYPDVAIQEDYFIWGAANHIYHPEPKSSDDLQVDLAGIVLNEDAISRILVGRGEGAFIKRGDVLVVNDYDHVLVITQAANDSCIRVIDGNLSDLSLLDQQRVMLIAPYSRLEAVVPVGDSPAPPVEVFGNEPPHEWCYYYQKADLARQQGDWEKVSTLYKEATNLGYHADDQVEWMPFLQAFAYLGDQKKVKELSTRMNTQVFYKEQACRALQAMPARGYPLTPEMQSLVDELFCK